MGPSALGISHFLQLSNEVKSWEERPIPRFRDHRDALRDPTPASMLGREQVRETVI